MILLCMTTSRRFKCVPTFHGSFSIHIFMLLFRLIADSSVFTSNVTQECKTTIESEGPLRKCVTISFCLSSENEQ